MAAVMLHRTGVPTPAAADLADDEVVVAVYGPADARGLVRFYAFWLDPDAPSGVHRQRLHRDLTMFVVRHRRAGRLVTARDGYTADVLTAMVDPLNVEIAVDRVLHHHGPAPLLTGLELDLVLGVVLTRDITAGLIAERLHLHRRVVERHKDRLRSAA